MILSFGAWFAEKVEDKQYQGEREGRDKNRQMVPHVASS